MNSRNSRFCRFATLLTVLCLFGSVVYAQEKTKTHTMSYGFCQNQNNSYGDKVSFNETREMVLPASSLLTVDGQRNGGIWVKGGDRNDILVRACVRAWGTTEEAARSLAQNIRIDKSPVVRAENSSEENWSVSYEIHVPRQTNLKLTAHNGGIGITGVEGNMEFETLNGGLHLSELAGNVRGRTTNGGLHIQLSGNSWKGAGLDLETTNGGVHLSIPENYAANFEAGTVNGGWHSNVQSLQVERKEGRRATRLNTALNGGGALVRLITTNGGVHINSSGKSKLD